MFALLLSVLLCLGAEGCGTAAKAGKTSSTASTSSIPGIDTSLPPTQERGTITTSQIPSGQRFRGDGDADNPGDTDGNGDIDPEDGDSDQPVPNSYRFPDKDDRPTFAYGKRPSIKESSAIASVVERYYADASAHDGSAACSLLPEALAKSVPADYGHAGGSSPAASGRTCKAVLSALFQKSSQELSEAITVVAVRVTGSTAQVVLASRKIRASSIFLTRQGGSWKLQQLLALPLP